MGSKNRVAKHIVPIIQSFVDKNIETTGNAVYIEPFVGGANIIDKIKCKHKIGLDENRYLVKLLEYVSCGGELPTTISRDEYSDVRSNKNNYPEWYVGAVGFLASYNGRFFDGGYAQSGYEKTKNGARFRDYYKESKSNLEKQRKNLKGIDFIHRDFFDNTCFYENCVIYCDPPYEGAKKYANAKNFDYDAFWDKIRLLSKTNIVLVSEQRAPKDFSCIWQQEVSRSIKATNKSVSTEKLFVLGNT